MAHGLHLTKTLKVPDLAPDFLAHDPLQVLQPIPNVCPPFHRNKMCSFCAECGTQCSAPERSLRIPIPNIFLEASHQSPPRQLNTPSDIPAAFFFEKFCLSNFSILTARFWMVSLRQSLHPFLMCFFFLTTPPHWKFVPLPSLIFVETFLSVWLGTVALAVLFFIYSTFPQVLFRCHALACRSGGNQTSLVPSYRSLDGP